MSSHNVVKLMDAAMPRSDPSHLLELGRSVMRAEAEAVLALANRLDLTFNRALDVILACTQRVVVTGMGKSGHIGSKIAATLASTGTPAFFVHPGEASHGDLGMITAGDVVIALSNSGESSEVITILPLLKRLGVKLIGISGNPRSTLARNADVHLDASVEREAGPLGLAPTSSTTAALALGDALALALIQARGFSADDFARSHPGGSLGRRLLVRVEDIMHTGAALPTISESANLKEALFEMTRKGLGMTAIIDASGCLAGIYTDGDLRRTLENPVDLAATAITAVMHRQPHTIQPEKLAAEAVQYMEQYKINGLLVVDNQRHLVGALNMHDLFRAGVI